MSESEVMALSTLFNVVACVAFISGVCVAILAYLVIRSAYERQASHKYFLIWKRRAESVDTGAGFRVIK